MKKISAKIIADSVDTRGNRITTMVLTFPRFILAELNTHRMFSKNSASSRAIPFKTMVKRVKEDPFVPIAWQKDHKGMQGSEYFTDDAETSGCIKNWLHARDMTVEQAVLLNTKGVTKQLCNRLLEPFMWHTVILTATEFDNFFNLRCPQYKFPMGNNHLAKYYKSKKDLQDAHPKGYYIYDQGDIMGGNIWQEHEEVPVTTEDWLRINKGQSEIHMMELAECMWDAMNESTPWKLQPGEYHIPFGEDFDEKRLIELRHKVYDNVTRDTQQFNKHLNELKVKIATARCARVSYLNFEGKDDYEADVKLYGRLSKSGHWSPFEHVAKCMTETEYHNNIRGHVDTVQETTNWKKYYPSDESLGWCRNFKGFIQLREDIE